MDNQTWQTPPAAPQSTGVFNAPPKTTFALGVMVGISVVSLLGFILSFAAYRNAVDGGTSKNTNTAAAVANTNTNPAGVTEPVDVKVANDDWIRGKKDAPVTLVEFSDFQCPYCSQFDAVIDQVRKDYPDDVRIVYKHYPLTSLHPMAQKAGEAAECAGNQNKFWEMHDKLFDNQTTLSVENFKAWAKELGLKQSTFDKCLDDGEEASAVTSDQTYGDSVGVSGTPTSFVNGYVVQGAQSYDYVKAKIDAQLAS